MAAQPTTIFLPTRFRIREVAIVAAVADVMVLIWSSFYLSSRFGFRVFGLSLLFAVFGSVQFTLERSILRHRGTAMGEVVEYYGPNDGSLPVSASWRLANSNSIRYRFATPAGVFHHGECTTNDVPTEIGSPIAIVYDKRDPAKNMPSTQVWFFTMRHVPVRME